MMSIRNITEEDNKTIDEIYKEATPINTHEYLNNNKAYVLTDGDKIMGLFWYSIENGVPVLQTFHFKKEYGKVDNIIFMGNEFFRVVKEAGYTHCMFYTDKHVMCIIIESIWGLKPIKRIEDKFYYLKEV